MNIDENDIIDILEPLGGDGDAIVQLPKELEEAPENIKAYYIKWVELSNAITYSKRRYFQFINCDTDEVEQVDTMMFEAPAVQLALTKCISVDDLKTLKTLCREMAAIKGLKASYKIAWTKWARPLMGKSVFDWRKADILDLFAKYATFDEVKDKCKEWGYNADNHGVYKFFLRNKETIDRKRLEFIKTARDHYLATDAGRMETLAMLHTRFTYLFSDAYKNKELDKLKAGSNRELIALSAEIRAIIEQARKEIKGDEIRLTVDGRIDINASLHAGLAIQEISKKIPMHLIPIYLVAAKTGIDPHNILASLVSSFYKDFNGFTRLNGNLTPPTTFDLIRNYNWNEIAQYQKEKEDRKESAATLTEYEEIPFVKKEVIKSKREKLLDMINKELEEKKNK